jgi:two-component system capsular synthesis response regulator RcsB
MPLAAPGDTMKTTIVIADDHPIILAGIRDVIDRDQRFEVIGEAHGPEALVAQLHKRAPDIVITDFNMPGDDSLGDGVKLIDHLRRNFPQVSVLVLTMVSNPSIIAAMYRAGARGVVRKAGDLTELGMALNALMAQRMYRSPALPREGDLPSASPAPAMALLSPREFEVIRLFASGQTVGDIAKRLNRSSKTISTQKVSAMRKLGARTDHDLITFCLEADILW